LVTLPVLPLLMTGYSFRRYSAARETYEQTIQALGIVPELAGHVSLGHSERTAAYVVDLARSMALPSSVRDRLVMTARLHDIGRVALEDDPSELGVAGAGRAGAEMLRETGFLAGVADLVEAVGALPESEMDIGRGREAALVRVAGAFDDMVGDDASRARGALAILKSRLRDPESSEIVSRLRQLHDEDPAFVARAIEKGAPLTRAAAAAEKAHRDD
jgi:hypothetical protein